jgi:hypothetical protein
VQDLGQAPVHHLDLAEAAHHDVGGLQVAVDHPLRVGIGHRLGDLLEDPQEPGQVVGRRRALGQQGREGAAADQLHREERPMILQSAQVVDRDDAGVLELAADLCLLDEPPHDLGPGPVLFE